MIPINFQRLFSCRDCNPGHFGSEGMGTKKVCTPSYYPGILGDDHQRVFWLSCPKMLKIRSVWKLSTKKFQDFEFLVKNGDTKKTWTKKTHDSMTPHDTFLRHRDRHPESLVMTRAVDSSEFQEFQSPLAWHTEEEWKDGCVNPWESAGNLIWKNSAVGVVGTFWGC